MHPRDRAIIKAYQDGASLALVGERFGLSQSGVQAVLMRHKVKRRPRGKPLKLAGEWLKG